MEYFLAIITLFAGTGTFLFGFKVLSDNTEKLADSKMRALFNRTSDKKLVSMGVGAITTAVIQSSAATTVMVIGLVNAGIMSLYQATAMIMGANIGTTISAQIVVLQAFNIMDYAAALAFIGILINMFGKSDRAKTLGYAIAGLGLIFVGLSVMSGSMNVFKESDEIMRVFQSVSNPFALFLIGIIVTALIQSSSAVTSILISMAGAGITIGSGGNAVLFVILGSNVGTCVTALISSIDANTNARRAGIIHLLFNVVGSAIFFIILVFWKDFKAVTFDRWFAQPETQLAMFHTFFNCVCVALFLPFTKVFVWAATKIVKGKTSAKPAAYRLDDRFLKSPALALNSIIKEASELAVLAHSSFEKAVNGFIERDQTAKFEVDRLNKELAERNREAVEFLVDTSMLDTTIEDKRKISSLHYVLNDVMRVSELAENITRYTQSASSGQLVFSSEVLTALRGMNAEISTMFFAALNAFSNDDFIVLKQVEELEDKIDMLRKTLINEHIERLSDGRCQPESSTVFINLVGNMERAADHIDFIAHSIEKYR